MFKQSKIIAKAIQKVPNKLSKAHLTPTPSVLGNKLAN